MDRKQVEDKIAQMFLDIAKLAREYYPEDRYLHCAIVEGNEEDRETIHINNAYFEHKEEGRINAAYKVKGGEIVDRFSPRDR